MKNLNYLTDATNEIIAATFLKDDDDISLEEQVRILSIACGALGTLAYDEEFYKSLIKVRALAEEHRREFLEKSDNINEFFDSFIPQEMGIFKDSGLSDESAQVLINTIISIKDQLSKGFDTPEDVINDIEDVQNIVCNLASTQLYVLQKIQAKEMLKGTVKGAGLVISGGSIIAINAMAGAHVPVTAAFSGLAGGKVLDMGVKHFKRR